MSRAFVRETDGEDEDLPTSPSAATVQGKTYLTQAGYQRLSAELKQWVSVERPKVVEVVAWAASNGDRSENGDYLYGKKRMREIDRRIGFLTRLLKDATVVDPAAQTQRHLVFFGARVTVLAADHQEKTVHIVGTEEADPAHGLINFRSPLAQALLKRAVGDEVVMHTPDGEVALEIVRIEY